MDEHLIRQLPKHAIQCLDNAQTVENAGYTTLNNNDVNKWTKLFIKCF